MNAISKFRRSWALAQICFTVLGRNKKLLVFPVVTFCFWVVMIALFFAPLAVAGISLSRSSHPVPPSKTALLNVDVTGPVAMHVPDSRSGFNGNLNVAVTGRWIFWLTIYVGAMLVSTFANVAFYHEILSALRGGNVSVRNGISFALSRWKSILLWSLFAGFIGLIIRTIEEKVGFIGKIVTALLGAAWSTACVFVIPVLVESNSTNPVGALKKSATILLRTWGEAIIGFAGLRVGDAIVGFSSVFMIVVALALGAWLHTIWLPAAVVISWLLVLFAYSYVMTVASHIYRGALYLYASEGLLIQGFSADMMNDCWKRKKR